MQLLGLNASGKKRRYVWPVDEATRSDLTRQFQGMPFHPDVPTTKDWLIFGTFDDRLVFINTAAIELVEVIADKNGGS